MTGSVNFACRFFCLFVEDRPAAIAAMMSLPGRTKDITACSRLVTLPDWQGLGLAMNLIDRLAAAYKAVGKRVHTYPAHPALIRAFDKSPRWALRKKPGQLSRSHEFTHPDTGATSGRFGGRPNAVFEFAGAAHADRDEARRLLDG
jgi:GNAT superfamily N-acetyltransferase